MPARSTSVNASLYRKPKENTSHPSSSKLRTFRNKVYNHYGTHGRDLPWRKRVTPYRVLVSEIMLQQTQVERVIEKYKEFLSAFPDFPSLASAPEFAKNAFFAPVTSTSFFAISPWWGT